MDELDEARALLDTPLSELDAPARSRSVRSYAPIVASVAVSLLYLVAVMVVVVGLLRFTREHLRRLQAQPVSASGLLARLPFRR